VVNAASNSQSATPLNIAQAVTAGFSPDGLKTFIVGNGGNSLYIYSTQQALQGPIALTGPANSIGFSPNGAFAFVAQQAPSPSGSANLSAFSICNNQLAANLLLPANPLFMRVLPGLHIDGADSSGNLIPDGIHVLLLDATGFDVVTSTILAPATGTLCPQTLTFGPLQRIELRQGKLQPVNFFVSADSSSLYIASTGNASILVYDFNTGAVTGIELQGSVTPLSADMSADAGTILVAGSDGMLHEISTALGGFDQFQLTFPSLPNYLNPFCTFTPIGGACTFNTVLARP
jgi:WD40 repeat protein